MWMVLRFYTTEWLVRPFSGSMNYYEDERGRTENIIAIFHREIDAKAYTQLLNKSS